MVMEVAAQRSTASDLHRSKQLPDLVHTELGFRPSDWRVVKLSQIVSMKSGETITSSRINQYSEYPCYGGNGLRGFTDSFTHNGTYALVGRQGALCGNVTMARGRFFASEHAVVVTALPGTCPDWIAYVLDSMRLNQYSESSAQPGLSVAKLLMLPVSFPPNVSEQKAIAAAISDVDALITSLEHLIEKKRLIKQGLMQELLSGRRRLPGFGGEWKDYTLSELAGGNKIQFDDGDWIEAEHLADSGVRFIQTGNIGVGTFTDRTKKYVRPDSVASLGCKFINPGDLLICRLADPAGRACILPDLGEPRMVTSVDVTIFRPDRSLANRVFLSNLFSMNDWLGTVRDRSGGTTHKRIARQALGKLKVCLPEIQEQDAIAQILSNMDAEIDAVEARLEKARQIKQGMMQELLTGRVRLV